MTPPSAHSEANYHTYRVTWSAEDSEFVATCATFPSLSWLAPSLIEALQGLQDVVRDVIADIEEQGEHVPQPFLEAGQGEPDHGAP